MRYTRFKGWWCMALLALASLVLVGIAYWQIALAALFAFAAVC